VRRSADCSWRGTYPLLRQTTSTLVLGVSEEFDDTLLVGSKAAARVSVVLRGGAGGARARGEALRSAGPRNPQKKLRNVPGDLTGDLADELGALGQETLPPRDPGGRSPGGDLCCSR
jgi:hypothetical protein